MKIFRDLTSSLTNRKKRFGRRTIASLGWSSDTSAKDYYQQMLQIDTLCEEVLSQNQELHAENEMNLDLIEKVEQQMTHLKAHMEKVQKKADAGSLGEEIETGLRGSLVKVLAEGEEWGRVLKTVLGKVFSEEVQVKGQSNDIKNIQEGSEQGTSQVKGGGIGEKDKGDTIGENKKSDDVNDQKSCSESEDMRNDQDNKEGEGSEQKEGNTGLQNEDHKEDKGVLASQQNGLDKELKIGEESEKLEGDLGIQKGRAELVDEETKQIIRKGFNQLANKVEQLYHGKESLSQSLPYTFATNNTIISTSRNSLKTHLTIKQTNPAFTIDS